MISCYMPRGEYQPRHYEPTREDRVRLALETLEHGIDAIVNTDGFTRYLRMMSRLTHYSPGNLAFIYAQCPQDDLWTFRTSESACTRP
jgi:hypothetical protein